MLENLRPKNLDHNATVATGGSPQEEKQEPKLNEFGLPDEWSHYYAMNALEYIQARLEKVPNPATAQVDAWLGQIEKICNQEFKKYKPNEYFSVRTGTISDVSGANGEKFSTLKMTREEKLGYLNRLYPLGLKILQTNAHVSWDKIVDYEMWAVKNSGQTLAESQRRNGLGAAEIVAMISGVKPETPSNNTDARKLEERCLNWLKVKGYFVG